MDVYCRSCPQAADLPGQQEVSFAASYLTGDALTWFLARRRAGEELENWQSLKAAISIVFGPTYVDEEAHLSIFRTHYIEDLDAYVAEFCRWSLQLSEMNEVTQTMLFVRGLPDCTQREVLRDHPRSLSEAISGARAALR